VRTFALIWGVMDPQALRGRRSDPHPDPATGLPRTARPAASRQAQRSKDARGRLAELVIRHISAAKPTSRLRSRLSSQHRVLALLLLLAALTTPADPSLSPDEGQFCPGSPASSVLAARSTAVGDGLSVATAGVPAAFTILAREANGAAAVNSDATFHVDFEASAEAGGARFETLAFSQPCPSPAGGCVAAVEIVAGGSGCLSDGELRASGGGGSGFVAEFTQSGGAVVQVRIVNAGEGYTSAPALAISAGGVGCSGFEFSAAVHAGNEHTVRYTATAAGEHAVRPALVRRGGLAATYFRGASLTGAPFLSRIEPQVNHAWGEGGVAGAASEGGAARWEGKLRADEWGEAVMTVRARGGVRLRLGGSLLIDRWEPGGPLAHASGAGAPGGELVLSRTFAAAAGALYPIVLEYRHVIGPASVSLEYKPPSGARRVLAAEQLFYSEPVRDAPLALRVLPAAADPGVSTLNVSAPALPMVAVLPAHPTGRFVPWWSLSVKELDWLVRMKRRGAASHRCQPREASEVATVNAARGCGAQGAHEVLLQLRDVHGNRALGSEAAVNAALTDPDGAAALRAPQIAPLGGGAYAIKLWLPRSGSWSLNVTLNGTLVAGSPLALPVVAGPFDSAASVLVGNRAMGTQFAMTRGAPATLLVQVGTLPRVRIYMQCLARHPPSPPHASGPPQARDAFGNNVTDDASLRVSVVLRLRGVTHYMCPTTRVAPGLFNASCSQPAPGVFLLEVCLRPRRPWSTPDSAAPSIHCSSTIAHYLSHVRETRCDAIPPPRCAGARR